MRKFFKYINTIRSKRGKLRDWPQHNRLAEQQKKLNARAQWYTAIEKQHAEQGGREYGGTWRH